MRYYETHSTDPVYNLAFEEALFECFEGEDALILWQNSPSVIIGLNQNAAAEIDRSLAEARGVKLVRRMSGGGAVYHDLGNLNYSFISGHGALEGLEHFARPVLAALKSMGLEAELSGRNDILAGGRKLSGVARRTSGDKVLQHGTLLFDSDLTALSALLRPDERKYASKATKSVRSRVGNIRPMLPEDMSLREFWQRIKESLAGSGFETAEPGEAVLRRARQLAEEKYGTWQWNWGRSPRYSYNNSARFAAGTLAVSLEAKEGCIEAICFSGDLMTDRDLSIAAKALTGCALERKALTARLSAPDIAECFAPICTEELVSLILNDD